MDEVKEKALRTVVIMTVPLKPVPMAFKSLRAARKYLTDNDLSYSHSIPKRRFQLDVPEMFGNIMIMKTEIKI